jgi:hypothetical protein
VIGFPGFRAVQPVSMGSETIPFCRRVKSLGLTINSRFAWDDQNNIVCRRVYFTLKCLLFLDSGWYAVTIGSVTCFAIVSLL